MLKVNAQNNRSEANTMNVDGSRDNNLKTPQGQNNQCFTENLLRGSSIRLQHSHNTLRSNGNERDNIQVSNPHSETTKKGFKKAGSCTETSQENCLK